MAKILPLRSRYFWECCVARAPDDDPDPAYRIEAGRAETLLDAVYASMGTMLSWEDGRPAKGARRRVWEILPTGQRKLAWHDELPLDEHF